METQLVTFEITKPYTGWVMHFEQSRQGLEASDIKVLFRGSQKGNESKMCVILQAHEGKVEKFMEANSPMIAASGHVFKSTNVNIYKS